MTTLLDLEWERHLEYLEDEQAAACAYCGKRRGHQTDHLITRNQARRRPRAAAVREFPQFKVRCCSFCNQARGVRNFVPASHEHLIPELEELTKGRYRVWRGDPESLREVQR